MKKQDMSNVNKTLYIPLYGKSFVSKRGLFLEDPKAEEIWDAEKFPLKGKSRSKYLAYYMGMRSAVFDAWAIEQMVYSQDAVIIHLGCGMDSRVLRVGESQHVWYDVDFPDVIAQRKRYYQENSRYQMIAADVRDPSWLDQISQSKKAIVVMEGVSMYLMPEELERIIQAVCDRYETVTWLMDCYSVHAARLSRYKNPINDVGVTKVYGIDDPRVLDTDEFHFVREHEITPKSYVACLRGLERQIFSRLYAGKLSRSLYRMYEYKKINLLHNSFCDSI